MPEIGQIQTDSSQTVLSLLKIDAQNGDDSFANIPRIPLVYVLNQKGISFSTACAYLEEIWTFYKPLLIVKRKRMLSSSTSEELLSAHDNAKGQADDGSQSYFIHIIQCRCQIFFNLKDTQQHISSKNVDECLTTFKQHRSCSLLSYKLKVQHH